jgi:hypothetical protein
LLFKSSVMFWNHAVVSEHLTFETSKFAHRISYSGTWLCWPLVFPLRCCQLTENSVNSSHFCVHRDYMLNCWLGACSVYCVAFLETVYYITRCIDSCRKNGVVWPQAQECGMWIDFVWKIWKENSYLHRDSGQMKDDCHV